MLKFESCNTNVLFLFNKLYYSFLGTNNSKKTEELSQELAEVKAKLSHKNHLLSRVKPLLIKAAAKERALHEELFYLRNLLPESSTNCKDVKVSLSF